MNRRSLLLGITAAGAAGLGWAPGKARAALSLCFLRSGYAPSSTGTSIYYEVHGNPSGPPVFLAEPILATGSPVNSELYLAYLTDRYQVLLADYPYGIGLTGAANPALLTAQQVCNDYLAVATAAGFANFAIAGYSWGANTAEVLATQSSRVNALAVGGWPALGGPYAELLQLSTAINSLDPLNLLHGKQYETYYGSLQNWPEHSLVAQLSCPRLNYVDSQDTQTSFGVTVDMIGRFRANRAELTALGWETTEINSGLGHTGGMLPTIAGPLLRSFFDQHL